MSSSYPKPFNPSPPKFLRGDRVMSSKGGLGSILGPEDTKDYEHNRPDTKWELVKFDQGPVLWVGNIWLKRI